MSRSVREMETGMTIHTYEWTGTCDTCGFEYETDDRIDHCGECGSCWTHCVKGEPHYDDDAFGVRDQDYGLTVHGEMEWVDITIVRTETGLLFTSKYDGATHEIKGITMETLDDELRNLGDSDFVDDLLNMVGDMGGGLWPEPDGSSTSYHLDIDAGVMTVIER